MIHVFSAGETLDSIADMYGVSAVRLAYDNDIPAGQQPVSGQALLVLIPDVVHTVGAGDTLYNIAAQYGISQLELLRNNPYLVNSPPQSGEVLVISYVRAGEAPSSPIGYAYPFIDDALLREVLLYISSLYCFSYGFNTDGTLVRENDERLITRARQFGASPVLVLTPRMGAEAFNSNLINQLIDAPAARDRLIQNVLAEVSSKGYSGVDMDFEYIERRNREGYTALVRDMSQALHSQGYTLSVALAPKTYREQPGLLYEGLDYGEIGRYADSVLLMTYEWGYAYGPPMAVAPLPNVERVLQYALTEIPPQKIHLGIPNYGYDWRLPYAPGGERARTIGNIEAIEIARRTGATIQYDQSSQAPFFEYSDFSGEHVVWFEDVRSIQQKFRLITDYGLLGAGYWSVIRPFRPNWLLLSNTFRLRDYP